MYPKVKVRQEQQEDLPEFQRTYLPSKSPEQKGGYTPPHVRASKSYISSSDVKTSSRTDKVNKEVANKNKVKTKVSEVNSKPTSVLPPRAVLSSPENDAMYGNKNKTKKEHSGLKKIQNLCQNKCKKLYETEKTRNERSWKY